MDYESASAIGDEGEELVSQVLHALQPRYGYRWFHKILIKQGSKTTQIDHLLVDRHGILILECKVRQNALLRGTSVDKKWTACYRGRRRKSFQNPLLQNMEHASVLRWALKCAGFKMPSSEYFQRAVVIVGANLDELELDSVDVPKVVDLQGLPHLLEERYGFCVNAGDLTGQDVERLEELLRSMNRSEDLDVLAEHAAHVRQGPIPLRPGAPAPVRQPQAVQRPAYVRQRPSPKVGARKSHERYVGAAIWLLCITALLIAFSYWASSPAGIRTLGRLITRQVLGVAEDPPPPAPTLVVNGPPLDLAAAKRSYAEAAPDKYKATLNLNSPKRSMNGRYTTYGWDYTQRTGGKVQVKTIYLTFEPDGRIRGVSTR